MHKVAGVSHLIFSCPLKPWGHIFIRIFIYLFIFLLITFSLCDIRKANIICASFTPLLSFCMNSDLKNTVKMFLMRGNDQKACCASLGEHEAFNRASAQHAVFSRRRERAPLACFHTLQIVADFLSTLFEPEEKA